MTESGAISISKKLLTKKMGVLRLESDPECEAIPVIGTV
jgi:hypothetical protein